LLDLLQHSLRGSYETIRPPDARAATLKKFRPAPASADDPAT